MRRVDPSANAEECDRRARERASDQHRERAHDRPELGCTLESVEPGGRCRSSGTRGRPRGESRGTTSSASWFMMDEANYRGDAGAAPHGRADLPTWPSRPAGTRSSADCSTSSTARACPPEAYEHDMKLWWPHNEMHDRRVEGRTATPAKRATTLTGCCARCDYCKEHVRRTPSTASGTATCAATESPPMPAHEGLHVQGPLPRAPRAVHDRTSFDRVDWRLTT